MQLPLLHNRFSQPAVFERRRGSGYQLLPLRFQSLDGRRYLLSNFAGDYMVLGREELAALVEHRLTTHSPRYDDLKARHFLLEADSNVAVDLLAAQYRTRMSHLSQLTSLFLFVVTLRCDHSCGYCQVSRQSEDRLAYDMSQHTAEQAIDFVFECPSRRLKIEFQGGESLLNFPLIRFIVERVRQRNEAEGRDIAFVVATNLSPLTDEMLSFFRQHRVHVSTSLDGPRELHNRNRPRPGGDSYERTIQGIARVREALGHDGVAALMTTTEASLAVPEAIVDEYVRQGFASIFLRSISPYGFAVRAGARHRYLTDSWLAFYARALRHIIQLNRNGTVLREELAAIVLRKMLTPHGCSYVDLQSPAGAALSCMAFNYDGTVYASDEGRMLAEMGDRTFAVGRLGEHGYRDVITSEPVVRMLRDTMSEGVPMCSDCGFQPYCGSDPVFHHATQGDMIGSKPNSAFCQKNMGVIRHLALLLEDDAEAAEVLRGWV